MAITKKYSRVNWLNYDIGETPLDESNLNVMDKGISDIEDNTIALDVSKFNASEANQLIKSITLDSTSGIMTIVNYQGTSSTIDTGLSKLTTNFDFNEETQKIVLTMKDGSTKEIDLSTFVTNYEFDDTDTIDFTVANGRASAVVKNGSITSEKMQPDYLADITVQAQNASASAESASTHAGNAEGYASSANDAKLQAESAKDSAEESARQASESAESANTYRSQAQTNAESAESSKNTAVSAKESAESAKDIALEASSSASDSANSASNSASTATTQANKAKSEADRAKENADRVSVATTSHVGTVKPDGSTITIDADGTIHGSSSVDVATTTKAGIVKPDGTTITVDTDGTIHGNSSVTEQTVADWGFTKNTGTYSKPSSGIPKSDLSSAVQSAITNVAHYSTSSTFVAPTNRDADTLGGEAPSYYAKASNTAIQVVYHNSVSNHSVTIEKDGYYYLYANALAMPGACYLQLEINNLGNISSAHKNADGYCSLTVSRLMYLHTGDVIHKSTVNCEDRGDSYNIFEIIFIGNN